MASITSTLSAPNLFERLVNFIRHLSPVQALKHKSEFDRVYNALYSKLSIGVDFGDRIINFKSHREWEKLTEHSVGEIRHRHFFTDGLVASAQAFWEKGATVFRHCHSNADQFIYLINGRLEVDMDNKKFIVEPDADNPFVIVAGMSHVIKALENSVLVAKFVIHKN
jgi:quercetin dioxygenase-like cupin family protein